MAMDDDQTVDRVQALVIYAIVLHAQHQPTAADQCISRAALVATNVGMQYPSFAQRQSLPSAVNIESARRIWWELYSIDVYFAALHHRPRHLISSGNLYPLLPCSQAQYEAGYCDAMPSTIPMLDGRVFNMNPGVEFSSYCYRIEAARIIDRILALAATDEATPDDVQAIDNALVSWKYNLPSSRSDAVSLAGEVDQMLFQAHCLIACAAIFLHFPRSDLPATVPTAADITCAKEYQQLTPTSAQHTTKAIAASKELSNLAAVPYPMERHSPLFACALILGCIVQLAAASTCLREGGNKCLQHHWDRLNLMISTLKFLGERWKVAQIAAQRLMPVAKVMFAAQAGSTSAAYIGSADDSGSSTGYEFNDMSWFDLLEPEILSYSVLNV
ncbi:hypothetical protein LTR62_003584 [Meristemomyces frigidus]|uniref:Xylanolytic transcriptional activator regulatory domain-containing protein n=1 Tax=Meristemomyces frigidus TaxID=1508187 RepID=A0AAN7TRQ8_9PEZI|nr:hypothetical protein LTR62_003584 [Meristemomyces frigidus]